MKQRKRKPGRWISLALLAYRTGMKDNVFSTAGSMTYSTLTALVPGAALCSAILGGLGVLQDFFDQLYVLLSESFGRDIARQFVDWISTNSNNALSLGIVGLFSFLITMLLLVNKVWTQINRIYHTSMRMKLSNRLAGYFLVLIASVALIVCYLFLRGRTSMLSDRLFGLKAVVPHVRYAFAGSRVAIVFALLCILIYGVPETKVRWSSALTASLFGTVAILIVGQVMGRLTSMAARYSVIYGSLAALFLLLFWLYVLWLVVLWCVEFAYVLQFRPDEKSLKGLPQSPALQLSNGMNVMMLIAANFRDGNGATKVTEMVDRLAIPGWRLSGFLDLLEQLRFIQPIDGKRSAYTVARPLEDLRIKDLVDALYGLETLTADDLDTVGEAVAKSVRNGGTAALGNLTVENLLERV